MHRYKRSRQRDAILDYLRSSGSHPTAQDIHADLRSRFPNLSLGTVYRNLNILLDLGHVRRLDLGGNLDRFEARTDPHYHFVCMDTGEVMDLELDARGDLERRVREETGLDVRYHRIDFFGYCESMEE